jgi:hypothetical protein
MPLAGILFVTFLWLILFWLLGIPTLFKRHYVFFVLGFPIPIFWALGALLPARGE